MHQVTWYFNQYSSYMISILLCILISYIKKVSSYLPGQQPGSDEVTINVSLQRLLTCLKGSVEVLFLLRNYFDQFSLLIHNHVDIQLKFLWFHSTLFDLCGWLVVWSNSEIILISKKYHNWWYYFWKTHCLITKLSEKTWYDVIMYFWSLHA